ncbi:F-box only protein 9 [Culicoides brevitarsis]|uniref:F-box only protein 9 n=1 Tax=Culicoides brevitarsis TaxID=469753 RepID=UPI00307C6EA8
MFSSVDLGADSDDESSSSAPKDPEKELDEFRNQWKSEIKGESASVKGNNNNETSDLVENLSELSLDPNEEQRATQLFLQGAELERKGKLYDAIRLYRRAIQLVPDIEKRIYERNKMQSKVKGEKRDKNEDKTNNNEENDKEEENEEELDDDEDLSNVDLLLRFQLFLQKSGQICKRSGSDKVLITTGAHFCDLPAEIILYIFRWVVSNELDVQSLDKCSEVCKGFYVFARDTEIWRAICVKVWGVNVGLLDDSPYLSWRQMFYERHRVLFSGAYISKTSYLRYGENSFQDQYYRPIHLIEYYRFIRFFPNGTLMMYTSSDEPQNSVAKLKNVANAAFDTTIHTGHYRLHNDMVIIVLKPRQNPIQQRGRRQKGQNPDENRNRVFCIELKIQNSSKRKFCKLEWSQYSMIQVKNKREETTPFDLTPNMYPPFWFSKVKNYHSEANAALT